MKNFVSLAMNKDTAEVFVNFLSEFYTNTVEVISSRVDNFYIENDGSHWRVDYRATKHSAKDATLLTFVAMYWGAYKKDKQIWD